MTRIDRKTGEPILSPKLTADQLYAMANEPGWRPWMRLIAEHPHAWPALIDWWHNAQRQGFDAAGAAPKPPESMRRRRRVAIPSAPLPPEDEPGQEPVPASMESVDETRTAEPEQSHPDDSAEKALKDADGDFAALEQVAAPEPTTMSLPPISEPEPTETGKTERLGGLSAAVTYSADLDDLKVRRVFPVGKALVAIVMAASLIAVSWMGLQIKNRHVAAMRQEAHETAISACDSAEATRRTIQSDLDRTTAKASKLLKGTSRGQVADPKTLDALNRLLGAKTDHHQRFLRVRRRHIRPGQDHGVAAQNDQRAQEPSHRPQGRNQGRRRQQARQDCGRRERAVQGDRRQGGGRQDPGDPAEGGQDP